MQFKRKTEGKNSISKIVNWKLYIILLIASIFGAIAIWPYILTLQGDLLQSSSVPLYKVVAAQLIQTMALSAFTIFIGLYLAKKVGLGLPILEGWLEGREVKSYLKSILGISIGLGLLAGILISDLIICFPLQVCQSI